jgi:hypothetical protein
MRCVLVGCGYLLWSMVYIDIRYRLTLLAGVGVDVCAQPTQWAIHSYTKGRQKKKRKKNSQCTYVLYLARIELLYTYDDVIFLSRF